MTLGLRRSYCINIFSFTDAKLAEMRSNIGHEVERRSRAATKGLDAAAIIHGNELAKRALIVAASGGHSICFVGPPNCGKTMMRAAALELGLHDSFEARPCPCGNRTDPHADCECSVRQVESHLRKIPLAPITVEMHRPSERDRLCRGTTLADMEMQIARMSNHESRDLDKGTADLFSRAVEDAVIDLPLQESIFDVARTIANLDNCKRITASHVVEAINYRPLARWLT